jgi:hypothetical protein
MRHPTYKHLEDKLRIGAFSLGQWAQIASAGIAAAVFGGYLSPLPTQVTIFLSIIGAGLPIAISYGGMGMEFSVAQFARAGWCYWRGPRRYLAGSSERTAGYALLDDAAQVPRGPSAVATTGEEALLWDV